MIDPTDTTDRNLVNLTRAVLGTKVYRIYPLERFEAMLASRIDAVVSPTKWADPFENAFLERTSVMAGPSGPLIPLKNLATDWYGQCWSLREESDAMWRIYCPEPFGRAGVKVSGRAVRFLAERAGAETSRGDDGQRRYRL